MKRTTIKRVRARLAVPVVLATALATMGLTNASTAIADGEGHDASVTLSPRHQSGGAIPSHFVGLSIEWSLIERYMGPQARPAFTNLLSNLDSGVLRIGGSSQDLTPFDATAPNTNRVITPEDLADIRTTLDGTRDAQGTGWRTVLGTAMAPLKSSRLFVSPEHTKTFVEQGVEPAFAGADDLVAGIELGNEPDLTYRYDLAAYLADFARWEAADATAPYTPITPATSNAIATWQNLRDKTVNTRFFWDWSQILDTTATATTDKAGPDKSWAADHFYPLARTCASDPYRCPSIPALLEKQRTENLDYITYNHAKEAAGRGLGYRLQEINTAAGRGAHGVSDVAASAIWGLDTMFHVACPTPPDDRAANSDCSTGAVGVNFHNAEVRAFYKPEEGNAYYNAIDFNASDAMGAPKANPLYYAMLLFSEFAQGTSGLRPVTVDDGADGDSVSAWSMQGAKAERRMFLINRSDHPVTVNVRAAGSTYLLDRMSPNDPDGAGRTLDAPEVTIDGRSVAADGTWPGFRPTRGEIRGGKLTVQLGVGEAVVARVN